MSNTANAPPTAATKKVYCQLANHPKSSYSRTAATLAQTTGVSVNLQTGRLSYDKDRFEPLRVFNQDSKEVSIVFVRHGQVPDNIEPRTFNGDIERKSTKLTPKGYKQAEDAAQLLTLLGHPDRGIFFQNNSGVYSERLDSYLQSVGWAQSEIDTVFHHGLHIDHIYYSPLSRAKETAFAFLNKTPSTPSTMLNSLREMSFGSVDGKKLISVPSNNPYHLLRLDQNALAKDTHKACSQENKSENFAEVILRIHRALTELSPPSGTKTIALFAHSMTGSAARVLFGKAPIDENGHIYFDGNKGMMKNATPYVLSLSPLDTHNNSMQTE